SNVSKVILKSSFPKLLFGVLGVSPNKLNNVRPWAYLFYACQTMIFEKNLLAILETKPML
ncbi:MAG: hypothetical protein ACI4GW_00540, partial [Lachnospiraceae bacterium]